jgi:hypothetical protein
MGIAVEQGMTNNRTHQTYTLRSGVVVTSRDGRWPLQYLGRPQAEKAAEKIPGATVFRPAAGRAYYVAVPTEGGR